MSLAVLIDFTLHTTRSKLFSLKKKEGNNTEISNLKITTQKRREIKLFMTIAIPNFQALFHMV